MHLACICVPTLLLVLYKKKPLGLLNVYTDSLFILLGLN
jgi:hypothetical protein